MRLQRISLKRIGSFGAIVFVLVLWPALWQRTALAQTPTYTPPGGERLRDLAARRGLLIGFAPGYGAVDDPVQVPVIAAEASIFTPENNLKWFCIHPQPGHNGYNWNQTDPLNYSCSSSDADVKFAKDHAMQMHGHVLVWHEGLPAWVTTTPLNQLESVMNDHIDMVVGRYNGSNPTIGRVQIWDVVNEAIDCSGSTCRYRDSIWKQAMNSSLNGIPNFIVKAFQRARAADPNASLVYNDYDIGVGSPKSNFLLAELPKWKAAGIPINGVGLQMHIDTNFNQFDAFDADLQRFAALGLDIYITELDVMVPPGQGTWLYNQQAMIYKELMRRCLAQPRCKAFQTWGWTDKWTWRHDPNIGGWSGADPLLFDSNFTPKPAYYAVQETLRSVQLEAENANAQSGVIVYPGTMIGYVDGGDWVRFDNVDLGKGYTSLRAKYAKGNTQDDWVEVRLGSLTGQKIAELHVRSTGGWDYPAYLAERSTLLSDVTGKQTVYFIFCGGGGVGNFDWFRFENDLSQPLEVENRNASSGVEPVDPTGSTIIYNVQEGGWLRFDNMDLRSGYTTLRARYAKAYDTPVRVEVHQGSLTGPLLGILNAQNTGGWDTYKEFTTPINAGIGVQTLFFVFHGGGVNVDAFRLESEDAVVYVAPSASGAIGSLTYDAKDILAYYLSTGAWKKHFDGSDAVTANTKIDAFEVQRDGQLLLSFDQPVTLGGLVYDDSDVVRFTPTMLGETTAGAFSMYFDASDVGLDLDSEDTDALAVNPSNYPLLSTVGAFNVPSYIAGLPNLVGTAADVARFRTTTLGNTTGGAWLSYINGAALGLTTATENIDGVWMDPDGDNTYASDLYLGTLGAFALMDGTSGDGNDIFICHPTSTSIAPLGCRNRFFRDLGSAGLGTVAMGDFSISTTPRLLSGVSALVMTASSADQVENIVPIANLAEADSSAAFHIDDMPKDQVYPDDITSADLPTESKQDAAANNQIYLPMIAR